MASNGNIKKTTKIVFILFFICFVILQIYNYRWPTAELRVGDQIITVQVAKTFRHQKKGLGGREQMNVEGLLFPFDTSARHAIVMRNMEFPIDIVWLHNGVVVDIAANVPVEPDATEATLKRYYPRKEANAVLELPAGAIARYGLKIGHTVEHVK